METGVAANGGLVADAGLKRSAAIVRLACLPPDGPTGTFVDRQGTVPW